MTEVEGDNDEEHRGEGHHTGEGRAEGQEANDEGATGSRKAGAEGEVARRNPEAARAFRGVATRGRCAPGGPNG